MREEKFGWAIVSYLVHNGISQAGHSKRMCIVSRDIEVIAIVLL